MAPNNPMRLVPSNPSQSKLTSSPMSGNARIGVNTFTAFPNVDNPKSLGQPSANGFTVLPNEPKYTRYQGTATPKPIVNEPQAVQTTAKPVVGLWGIVKTVGTVGAVLAIPSVASDFGSALGYLVSIPQLIKNQNQKDYFDKLVKDRERKAQLALRSRIDAAKAADVAAGISTNGTRPNVQYRVTGFVNGVLNYNGTHPATAPFEVTVWGVVGDLSYDWIIDGNGASVVGRLLTGNGTVNIPSSIATLTQFQGYWTVTAEITGITRLDGQTDPPLVAAPTTNGTTQIPATNAKEWLYGDVTVNVTGNAAKMIDVQEAANKAFPRVRSERGGKSPDTKLDPLPVKSTPTPNTQKPFAPVNAAVAPLPIVASPPLPKRETPPLSGFPSNSVISTPFPVVKPTTTDRYQSKDSLVPTAKVTPVSRPVTTQPTATENNTVRDLLGITALIAALKIGSDFLVNKSLEQGTKLNQIASNTTPTAQQTNAKQGVCDAMQPNQCGFDGVKQATTEATNPIKDQTAANAGLLAQILAAIANLASTIATLFSNVVGKLDGIKEFLEKVARSAKLDKVYNLLTFLTVIHNAVMVSGSIGTTLMETLSLGLATAGIKDENESPIDIQAIINSTVENKVKSIIGVENYTTLSDRWKKAVRVYQAAANITYQMRSLWDSMRSLMELMGANVGRIGNALRRDGVVSENAYPSMADNPMMVNSPMQRLQNLEEAASHMNSITSEAYGMTETVAQIKKDQEDFKKLVKEVPITPGVANDAQKAKDDAARAASVSPPISIPDLVKP